MNDQVVINPEIQHGKTVIRGTRVPITRIIGGLAGGERGVICSMRTELWIRWR